MSIATRLIQCLAKRGRATTAQLKSDLPDVRERSISAALGTLSAEDLIVGEPIQGTNARAWVLTEDGEAQARELAEGRERVERRTSPRFGADLPRVRSVFDLPQVLAQ